MGRINIEIDDALHKKMKTYCVIHDLSIIHFINNAVEEKVKRDER